MSLVPVLIAVSGMSCEACAAKVQKSLATVPAVFQAQVDKAKDQAVVVVAESKYDEPALLKAIQQAGYSGKLVK